MRETHEAGMTAEQRVKAKWPDAQCRQWRRLLSQRPAHWSVDVYPHPKEPLMRQSLGVGATEQEAWADAASRLED